MDRLSSCYFCGDALDASVDEYPVVPARLRSTSDPERTVLLCRSCHRKLDSVLEAVVEAYERRELSVEADETPSGDSENVSGPAGDREATAPPTGNGDEPDHTEDSSVGDTHSEVSVEADRDGTSDDAEEDGESGIGNEDSGTLESGEIERVTETGESEPADAGGDQTEDATDTQSGDEPSLTQLEYNKVMRLLQNREFPVNRSGFVNVAANAYELTPRECEQILDLAIEHGIIDEKEGQLVKPEG